MPADKEDCMRIAEVLTPVLMEARRQIVEKTRRETLDEVEQELLAAQTTCGEFDLDVVYVETARDILSRLRGRKP
jgi:hypothetical protein